MESSEDASTGARTLCLAHSRVPLARPRLGRIFCRRQWGSARDSCSPVLTWSLFSPPAIIRPSLSGEGSAKNSSPVSYYQLLLSYVTVIVSRGLAERKHE